MTDRDRILAQYDVSRETSQALDLYVAELTRWQRVKNLVGPTTLSEVWTRHIADALQLLALAPEAKHWLDLGSGAGIPGLILAIAGRERPGFHVTLVEANARKCAFLSEAARRTAAPATIRNARIETIIADYASADIVCARALARLPQLVEWCEPLLKTGTIALFPKGRDAAAELTEAQQGWNLTYDSIPSRTDPDARILRINAASRQPERP